MTDETDTTSEVARVLAEHWHCYDVDCYGVEHECGLCGEVDDIHKHQAGELAKAALLREATTKGSSDA